MNPKIVLVGAGSVSFGVTTMRDLMVAPELRGSDLVLVDFNEERLDRVVRLAARMNETWEADFRITATTDRTTALPGADIVVGAVEQDRYKLWQMDIEIPRRHCAHELMGENGGPGGFFHTLRQVPNVLAIARDMERFCPNAWFVNMSNPESRVTLAVTRYSTIKTVGVCPAAYITRLQLADKVLGLPVEAVDIKAAGINHCHWVMEIHHAGTGEDLYPLVREKLKGMDPAWEPLSRECLRRFGYYPGPADTHVAEYLGWAWKWMPPGYTAWIFEGEREFERVATGLEGLAAGQGPLGSGELEPFLGESSVLRLQTMDIILGLLKNGNRYVLSLNVPNRGYITNLRQGAIVEVPAIISADRIYGLGMGDLPPAIAALLERQLTIMDLNVEAGVTGDRHMALEGLILDPLVPDPATAEKILDELLTAEAAYLPQFQ